MAVTVDDERNEVTADRTVRRSGGSYVVSIPPEILDAAGFAPDDDVVISRQHGSDSIEIRRKEEPEA